ncbi:MAG: hypothetical protein D3910_00715 [Candidatus Electrothrix sp. ATG2]|nr:hypothetical protein [Candidatus Electrothrix sp. ATG2]
MKLIVKKCTLSVFMLFFLGIAHEVIWAAENGVTSESKQTEEGLEEREVDKFQYKFEDRPDPFLPFLTKNSGRDEDPDEPSTDPRGGKALTGMQLFEPGQLRLVALLKVGNKNVAMVEDIAGKGYRLNENMLIGKYGIINRITSERVEITESYKTKTGRIVSKDIVMRLKKEGDK